MNKLVIALIVGMFGACVFAEVDPVLQELKDANIILNVDKNYVLAQAAYEKIISDNATTNQIYLIRAQTSIGLCLRRQDKISEARTAYAKAIADYPNVPQVHKAQAAYLNAFAGGTYAERIQLARDAIAAYPNAGDTVLAGLQHGIGGAYWLSGDAANTIIEMEKVKNYPKYNYTYGLFTAQDIIGDAYSRQRKFAEANAAWMLAVQNYVWTLNAKDESSPIWKTLDKISPKFSTAEAYKAFLETTIKATRATEENAKFLGKLKSELGKLQQ